MRPLALVALSVAFALCNVSCSVNILSTFANKNTDEAHYWNADADLKNHDWTGALSEISQMSTAYQATPLVIRQKASAYGGMCGVIFFDFVQKLEAMGTTRLMPFLLASFDASVAANIDNCILAQNTLLSIGSMSQRSDDDNFMIAIFAFAKIGNILSYYADSGHTGSASGSFNMCPAGTTRTNPGNLITDADTGEVGAGLALAIQNLGAVAGHISAGSGQLSSISNVCALLPAGFNFCSNTDPTAYTANELLGIRTLIKESSAIGLGSNCTGDPSVCHCP